MLIRKLWIKFPLNFRKKLSPLINVTKLFLRNQKKRKFTKQIQKKQKSMLMQINNKKKIKIIFLVYEAASWKTDSVIKLMLKDSFFEPLILVCPWLFMLTKKETIKRMDDTYIFFKGKEYPVIHAYNKKKDSFILLKDLNPDIIFFTNPHNNTIDEYHTNAYSNYLSCYVPYFFDATTNNDYEHYYNQYFHNAVTWIFRTHPFSYKISKKHSYTKGKNNYITGYPFCEKLLEKSIKEVWKPQSIAKKRIIFAPHHSFEEGTNFLLVAEEMRSIAKKYKEKIQWSFKPHPILKSKLYELPEWGKKKTDIYYNFWKDSSYTQLDEGEYIDLFISSDAIIHDSGSFLAEYLFVQKPCAYLTLQGKHFYDKNNAFLNDIIDSYYLISNIEDIYNFTNSLLNATLHIKESHKKIINEYVKPFYIESKPSKQIVEILKRDLCQNN